MLLVYPPKKYQINTYGYPKHVERVVWDSWWQGSQISECAIFIINYVAYTYCKTICLNVWYCDQPLATKTLHFINLCTDKTPYVKAGKHKNHY
jgi:hypothetical protein